MTNSWKYYENVTADSPSALPQETREEVTVKAVESRSSSTTAHARARANKKRFLTADEMLGIEDYYELNFGTPIPPIITNLIQNCVGNGMEPMLIQEAIDQTMLAASPSARYLYAILRRWNYFGIYTTDDLIADEERHTRRQEERYERRWRKTLDHDYSEKKLPF